MHSSIRLLSACTGIALLAGCATTKVENLAMTPTQAPAPSAVLVQVSVSPDLRERPEAVKAAEQLRGKLVERYNKEGMTAAASGLGATAATMRVEITQAKKEDKAQQLIIGFGAGSSQLRMNAVLEVPGTAGPALQFSTKSKSSLKPGLIVPGGIAIASNDASRLPIAAGLGALSLTRNGLGKDVDRSAKKIVSETKDHYERLGWTWPKKA